MATLLRAGTVSINIKEEVVDNWRQIQERANDGWRKSLPSALAANPDRFKDTALSFDLSIDDKWKKLPFKRDFRSEEGKILFSAEKLEASDLVELVRPTLRI